MECDGCPRGGVAVSLGRESWVLAGASALGALLCAWEARAQATFVGVGEPGITANAISADGSTVVGRTSDGTGYRWRRTAGGVEFVRLGAPLPPQEGCYPLLGCYPVEWVLHPYCTSADGNVVAGGYEGYLPTKEWCFQPFLWTSESGTLCLRGGESGDILALSPDGVEAYGSFRYSTLSRWTAETGWVEIADGLQAYIFGWGYDFRPVFGVAADVPNVVCGGFDADGGFILDLDTGEVEHIGTPVEESNYTAACGISADGSVVVGYSQITSSWDDLRAYRWTREGGLELLDGPDVRCAAFGAFRNGDVIIGERDGEAVMWTARRGGRMLLDVLHEDYAVDVEEWTLRRAVAITPDGRTIVGNGVNPDLHREAWVVQLGTPCSAEWNGDSRVNSQDFFDFLLAFFAGDADFNIDGATDTQDFFDFLTAFFDGCA